MRIRVTRKNPLISGEGTHKLKTKHGGEEADSSGEVEMWLTLVGPGEKLLVLAGKRVKVGVSLRLRSLPGRPVWDVVGSGVRRATTRIHRNHLVCSDSRLAHWAEWYRLSLNPLVNAGPTSSEFDRKRRSSRACFCFSPENSTENSPYQ